MSPDIRDPARFPHVRGDFDVNRPVGWERQRVPPPHRRRTGPAAGPRAVDIPPWISLGFCAIGRRSLVAISPNPRQSGFTSCVLAHSPANRPGGGPANRRVFRQFLEISPSIALEDEGPATHTSGRPRRAPSEHFEISDGVDASRGDFHDTPEILPTYRLLGTGCFGAGLSYQRPIGRFFHGTVKDIGRFRIMRSGPPAAGKARLAGFPPNPPN